MATILNSPNESPQERLRNRKQPLTSRTKATFSPDRFALKSQAILGFSKPHDYSVARVTLRPEDFIVNKLSRKDRGVQDEMDVVSVLERTEAQIGL
jgi:hypothetical protein